MSYLKRRVRSTAFTARMRRECGPVIKRISWMSPRVRSAHELAFTNGGPFKQGMVMRSMCGVSRVRERGWKATASSPSDA